MPLIADQKNFTSAFRVNQSGLSPKAEVARAGEIRWRKGAI
jgi:hypothetical protein